MIKRNLLVALIGCFLVTSVQAQSSEPQNKIDPTRSTVDTGSVAPTSSAYVAPDDYYWSSNTAKETTSRQPIATSNIHSLSDILSDNISDKLNKDNVDDSRAKALQETAYAFGLQAGLSKGTSVINNTLESKRTYYDQAFNFAALELEPGMLPPVISEGRDAYRAANDSTVRVATRIFKIEFPARLVATPPRWQDYLIADVVKPSELSRDSLPKSKGEKALWDSAVARGWNDGLAQATENYQDNLGRLKRDVNGMIRYRDLYQQGLVQKPILAKTPLGTTGGGDEMALNDRVIEITQKAALDPNSSRWSSNRKNPITAPNDK